MNMFKKLILKWLVRFPCPERIPRSGDAAKTVNCVSVRLNAKDNSWVLLIDSVHKNGVEGKYWIGKEDSYRNVGIPFVMLDEYNIEIKNYYGTYTISYSSFIDYILNGLIPIEKIKILMREVGIFFYKRKRLIQTDRMNTLKIIFEETLKDQNFKCSYFSLMNLIHTDNWVYHQDHNLQTRHVLLLLDSLVASEDLKNNSGMYSLTPKALITIENYEKELTKHKEILDQSISMKLLTGALVLVGLVQATVAYCK